MLYNYLGKIKNSFLVIISNLKEICPKFFYQFNMFKQLQKNNGNITCETHV